MPEETASFFAAGVCGCSDVVVFTGAAGLLVVGWGFGVCGGDD